METSHEVAPELTAERLRELLHYDPQEGTFQWRRSAKGVKRSKDMQAGCRRADGYRMIRIDRKLYLAHRLAWLYMTGEWPANDIDHINTVRGDDRFENLRDITRRANLENQRAPRAQNKAGKLGVTSVESRYIARIQTRQRGVHLGSFDSAEEAHAAYVQAKRVLHEGGTL